MHDGTLNALIRIICGVCASCESNELWIELKAIEREKDGRKKTRKLESFSA